MQLDKHDGSNAMQHTMPLFDYLDAYLAVLFQCLTQLQWPYRAVVVVGDEKGRVGVGTATAKEVIDAVQKSVGCSAAVPSRLASMPEVCIERAGDLAPHCL